jgi:endonuclease-3
MQAELFDFGLEGRIRAIRDRLKTAFGEFEYATSREPMGALIKSIISSRTKDEVSLRAYNNLRRLYPNWGEMALATEAQIEAAISTVTFADVKARQVLRTLQAIAMRRPDFDLGFLADEPIEAALAWLKSLHGAGPKVAAATMNFSTLECRAFVMDTHVLRVFRRLGLIGQKTEDEKAYDLLMAALQGWTSAELSDLHVLVKHLGQNLCRHNVAGCRRCPVNRLCEHGLKRQPVAA